MVATSDLYDPAEEQRRLLLVLGPRYEAILRAAHAFIMDNLPGVPIERLPLTDDAIRRALAKVTGQLLKIDETTQTAITEVLRVGMERGYSAYEIANGVLVDNYGGIEALYEKTWKARPETIARTELAEALNFASLDRYAASGVVDRVEIVENRDTDQPCVDRAGKVVPLTDQPGLLHVNCRVGLIPVLSAPASSGAAAAA